MRSESSETTRQTPGENQAKIWSHLHGDMQGTLVLTTFRPDIPGKRLSEIPCRVSGNEPVPANIGGARTTACGRARVVPREVVLLVGIDPVSTEAKAKGHYILELRL